MSEFIQTTVQNGVQTIRIARPEKKNALNIAMYEAMYQGLEESDRSPDMRVRLILGLPGIFTAGNDIADFIEAGQRGPAGLAPVMKFLRALIFSEKPIVAGKERSISPAVTTNTSGTTRKSATGSVVSTER